MALKPINIRWIRTGSHTENQVSSRIMDNFLRIVKLNIIILILILLAQALLNL